jgi:hypothetical protein
MPQPTSIEQNGPGRPKGSTVDPNETPRHKFERLAESRVGSALNPLRTIENLADKGQYEYTDDDVVKIQTALESGVASIVRAMTTGKKQGSGFKL